MKKRIPWVLFSLFFIAITVFASISFYSNYQVYKKGHLVIVSVESLPNSASSKGGWMKFNMNGEVYEIKIGSSMIQSLHRGDKVKLKYLEGYEDHFLFPSANPIYSGLFSLIVPLVFGSVGVYFILKKNPSSVQLPGKKR